MELVMILLFVGAAIGGFLAGYAMSCDIIKTFKRRRRR